MSCRVVQWQAVSPAMPCWSTGSAWGGISYLFFLFLFSLVEEQDGRVCGGGGICTPRRRSKTEHAVEVTECNYGTVITSGCIL